MKWSIIRALTWEYWQFARAFVPLAILFLVGGPWLFGGLIRLQGLTFDDESFPRFAMHMPFVMLSLFGWIVAVLGPFTQWRPRIYSMPISTRMLVTWQMTIALLTVAVVGPVTIWLYGLIFGVDWPVVEPTLMQLVGIAIAVSSSWFLHVPSTGSSLRFLKVAGTILVAVIGITIAFVFWVGSHYEGRLKGYQLTEWLAVSPLEYVVMAAVVALAWKLALVGADQHRHSDLAEAPVFESLGGLAQTVGRDVHDTELPQWLDAIWARFSSRARLRGPGHALSWMHWQDGRMVALVIGLGWAALMAAVMIGTLGTTNRNHNTAEAALVFLTMFPVLGGMFIGMVQGTESWGPKKDGMRTFLSASPVSDALLARTYMKNAFKSAVILWSMLVGAAALCAVIGWWRLGAERFGVDLERLRLMREFGIGFLPPYLVLSFAATWTACGLAAALTWTGRQKVMTSGVVIIFGLIFLAIIFSQFHGTTEWRRIVFLIETGTACGLAAVVWGATLLAFHRAYRSGLIDARLIWLALAVCCVVGTIIAVFVSRTGASHIDRYVTVYAMWTGAVGASIAPIAAGPLALAWNRHR